MGLITLDIIEAYAQCPLRAYFVLCTDKSGQPHDYERILLEERKRAKRQYLEKFEGIVQNFESLDSLGAGSEYNREHHVDAPRP
jgi:hypothetical protein